MMRELLTGSSKAIPARAKSDRKTEELSGAGLERDRIEAEEKSGNFEKMVRG